MIYGYNKNILGKYLHNVELIKQVRQFLAINKYREAKSWARL